MKQTGLYLLCLCLCVGLAACGSTGGQTSKVPTPTIIATQQSATSANASVTQAMQHIAMRYYSAIQNKDYAQAYSYLDAHATDANGHTVTLNNLEQMAQGMDKQEGPIVGFIAAAYASQVVMTITRAQMGPYHAHLQMEQEGGTWKITSLDRI
jgi:hypothetical protein